MSLVTRSKCKFSHQLKRSWILEAIRDNKQVSRSDLVKITGLKSSVVSRLTEELIQENLIEETGKNESTAGGRKPIWLSLSRTSMLLVGIDVGAHETKAVLTNLSSEILCSTSCLTPRDADGPALIEYFKGIIDKLLKEGNVDGQNLKGIAFALSGVVDSENGLAVTCCNLHSLDGLPVAELIHEYFPVPVVLTNSAGVWAVSECEHAKNNDEDFDFLTVLCSRGVGLIPLIDGKAPVGRNPKAKMDFGHTTHDPLGPVCNCGSRGCVEAYASGWAIERDVKIAPSKTLLEMVNNNVDAITTKDVIKAADAGDRECSNILRRAGEILGRNVARFIQYYIPSRVIFAGGLVAGSSIYFDAVVEEITRCMPPERFEDFKIQKTALDKYAGAVGATHLLVHEVLHAPAEDMIRITW